MAQQALQNGASSRNANQWRQVADFLDVQWLASMGLRRVARASGTSGEAGLAPREAHPVGNTGITSLSELANV